MLSLYFANTISSIVFALLPINGITASHWYISGGASQVNVTNGADFQPDGASIRAGFRLSKYMDVELTLSGNTEGSNGVFDEFSASIAGVSVKRYFPITRKLAVYGAIGGSVTELVQTINATELSDGDAGFLGGVGIETILYRNINIYADYTYHSISSDLPTVTAGAVGLKWNF